MFLPLKAALDLRRIPWITFGLIALNVLVYVAGSLPIHTQIDGSSRQIKHRDVWLTEYGAIPCEVTGRCANQDAVVIVDGGILDPRPRKLAAKVDAHAPALTLITSMFLHGSILHLVINMMFLWGFGRLIEDAMNPLGFLAFFVLGGLIAGMAQVLVAMSATSPIIGASGAIAAVIGGLLILYPRLPMLTMVVPPLIMWMPAWIVAGAWALLQLLATWRNILSPATLDGGVAYIAHVGGLIFGLATVRLFAEPSREYYLRVNQSDN